MRMKTGIQIIAAERQRQIDGEGWTAEHDDIHVAGEMAMAAAVYAFTPEERASEILRQNFAELLWPWTWSLFKPAKRNTANGRVRELAKAGALIAAEIDRLQRMKSKPQ